MKKRNQKVGGQMAGFLKEKIPKTLIISSFEENATIYFAGIAKLQFFVGLRSTVENLGA